MSTLKNQQEISIFPEEAELHTPVTRVCLEGEMGGEESDGFRRSDESGDESLGRGLKYATISCVLGDLDATGNF